MALIRFSPMEDMSVLRDQINRIFDPLAYQKETRSEVTHHLPIEVTETRSQYTVRALVPGVDPDQITLEATPKELVISYELQPPTLQENEVVHVNQFNYGKFTRRLAFPEAIISDRIDAHYANGILQITLPKQEHQDRKQITISRDR